MLVVYLEVQVRRGAVSDVSALGDYVALLDALSDMDAASTLAEVPVTGPRAIVVLDGDAVAGLGQTIAVELIDDFDDHTTSRGADRRANRHRKVPCIRVVAAVRDDRPVALRTGPGNPPGPWKQI